MSEFVSAYSKTTREKHRIPRHWLGHPTLGADFELTPSARAASAAKAARDDVPSNPVTSDQPTDADDLIVDEPDFPGDITQHESPSAGEEE